MSGQYLINVEDALKQAEQLLRYLNPTALQLYELVSHENNLLLTAGCMLAGLNSIEDSPTTEAGTEDLDAVSDAVCYQALWRQCGRPYYKVAADFVPLLCDTSLHVPAKEFKMPFHSWNICLPAGSVQDCPVTLSVSNVHEANKFAYDSKLATAEYTMQKPDIIRKLRRNYAEHMEGVKTASDKLRPAGSTYLHSVVIEVNVPQAIGNFGGQLMLPLFDGATLDDCVEQCDKYAVEDGLLPEHRENLKRMLRLAVATAGLITGNDAIIKPDILKKDEKRYAAADEDRKRELEERAHKRRGMKGWTIGKRDRILDLARQRKQEYEEGTGEKLKFQHQRAGHLHRYHTKQGMVTRFIPQLTVRPDLPVDNRGKAGVRIEKPEAT